MEYKLLARFRTLPTKAWIINITDAAFLLFSNQDKTTKARLKEGRDLALQTQLRVVDIGGANLLMIAASTASIAVFSAVTREIRPSQARNILTKRIFEARPTSCMYAVNPNAMDIHPSLEIPKLHSNNEGVPNKRECQSGILHHRPTQTLSPSIASRAPEKDESVGAAQEALDQDVGLETCAASPWVPIVKRVLEYARKRLCLPEIERMIELGEDNEYEQTAMRLALVSEGKRKMGHLVRGNIRHLKRDVAFRAESSTMTSKIQAFIPGNLIVIFHLLLPEIRRDCHAPLVLLAFICCIAPCWAWAASLVTKTQPERRNSLARFGDKHYRSAFIRLERINDCRSFGCSNRHHSCHRLFCVRDRCSCIIRR